MLFYESDITVTFTKELKYVAVHEFAPYSPFSNPFPTM